MRIKIDKALIGSKIVSRDGKVIIKEEVTPFEFEIIKAAYPSVVEIQEKKSKEKDLDIE